MQLFLGVVARFSFRNLLLGIEVSRSGVSLHVVCLRFYHFTHHGLTKKRIMQFSDMEKRLS